MFERQERTIIGLAISISAIILVVIVILTMVNRQPVEQTQTEPPYKIRTEPQDEHPLFESFGESSGRSTKTDTKPPTNPKVSLNDVIKAARTWQPAYQSWYGKTAPDFTLTDINGEQHKLSDYRGKSVLIVFWATWCRPCLTEIPHLIALRNTISKDKLAILGISYITPRNTTEMVKNLVERNKRINYTVFSSDMRAMPRPFNTINSIPCSFFINPDGKIKLATVGVLSLGAIKAILEAE